MKISIGIISLTMIAVLGSVTVVAKKESTAKPKIQTVTVRITERGFEPETFKLRRAIQAQVTFLRTTDATCVKEITVPDFNIRRELPLNQPVIVNITPRQSGRLTFACGMNMMRGQLIVQ